MLSDDSVKPREDKWPEDGPDRPPLSAVDLGEGERADRVRGLIQSGHGFTVETPGCEDGAREQRRCEFCGVLLTVPARDWLCQFEPGPWSLRSPARDFCECNWCLCRRQVECGAYLMRGRPRAQCGAKDCQRQLRNKQQRERRARQKARAVAA